jgi:hypothetical protein
MACFDIPPVRRVVAIPATDFSYIPPQKNSQPNFEPRCEADRRDAASRYCVGAVQSRCGRVGVSGWAVVLTAARQVWRVGGPPMIFSTQTVDESVAYK